MYCIFFYLYISKSPPHVDKYLSLVLNASKTLFSECRLLLVPVHLA